MLPENYQQTINKIVEKLKRDYQPEKIILFGSCARGDVRKWSDIDMLIVKDSDKPRRKRATEVLNVVGDIHYTIPFEPVVFTPGEFERGRDHFFIREIVNEGKTLYERS